MTMTDLTERLKATGSQACEDVARLKTSHYYDGCEDDLARRSYRAALTDLLDMVDEDQEAIKTINKHRAEGIKRYRQAEAERDIAVRALTGLNAGDDEVKVRLEHAAMLIEHPKLLQEKQQAEAALAEIAEGRGRFSLDPLTHATNTIEDMKAIAQTALARRDAGGSE